MSGLRCRERAFADLQRDPHDLTAPHAPARVDSHGRPKSQRARRGLHLRPEFVKTHLGPMNSVALTGLCAALVSASGHVDGHVTPDLGNPRRIQTTALQALDHEPCVMWPEPALNNPAHR